MIDANENIDMPMADEALLSRLLHLKGYERPDPVRMAKNRQNIMRRVRQADEKSVWSLADLLEVNIPWFFAEPRYGIALLFVVFAMLQFWGVNAGRALDNDGIYASNSNMALIAAEQPTFSTNTISYPQLPEQIALPVFADQAEDSGVRFVGRIESKK